MFKKRSEFWETYNVIKTQKGDEHENEKGGRQTDRQTERHTPKRDQTDRQLEKLTNKQTEIQIEELITHR